MLTLAWWVFLGGASTNGVGGCWYGIDLGGGENVGCAPYEVVGPSIPLDVGWGGPKAIGGMVFWPKYPSTYYPGKGYPYMGSGTPW